MSEALDFVCMWGVFRIQPEVEIYEGPIACAGGYLPEAAAAKCAPEEHASDGIRRPD